MNNSLRGGGLFTAASCLVLLVAGSFRAAERVAAEPDLKQPEKETRSAPADKPDSKPMYSFLFVHGASLGWQDRYLSVGTVVDDAIVVNKLMKLSRLGYYRVVAQPNEYDLWIGNDLAGELLCIDLAWPLVSEIIPNAEEVLSVTEEGLLFVSDRPRNTRKMGDPCLYYLDFDNHEVRSVAIPRKLDILYWRTAVVSPDGTKLASIGVGPVEPLASMGDPGQPEEPPAWVSSGFEVLVQDIDGADCVSLGWFPYPRRNRVSSPCVDPDLLMWVEDSRLVVLCGTGEQTRPYRFELIDVDSGTKLRSLAVPEEQLSPRVGVGSKDAENPEYFCYCRGTYQFDADLTSINLLAEAERTPSWRKRWMRLTHGWTVEPHEESVLVPASGEKHDLVKMSADGRTAPPAQTYFEVVAALDSPDQKMTYLVLMKGEYHVSAAILDRQAQTLIGHLPLHPVCWLDGPLLDFKRFPLRGKRLPEKSQTGEMSG